MCFYNDDYDWCAEVNEESEGPSDEACNCRECGATIAIGEWCKRVFQQEHEACQICEDSCSDDFIEREEMEDLFTEPNGLDAEWAAEKLKKLDEHSCSYGETYRYVRCEKCDKVIRAVVAHEKNEGCPEYSQQPALANLYDELNEHSDRKVYARGALTMFPELDGHPQLMQLLEPKPWDCD